MMRSTTIPPMLGGEPVEEELLSNRITDAAHIVERVVIGYYAAPSVRTELDLSRHTERSV